MDQPPERVNVADVAPASSGHEMAYELSFDAQLRPRTGTEDIENAFRLAFWVKDHAVGNLEREPKAKHPILLGFARVAEFVVVDFPLAAEATVLPHELFGHGGRIREFGGTAGYHFELPPPFNLAPSYTYRTKQITSPTSDSNTLVSQAGIAVEGYEVHAALLSSFEADTLNHIDSGLFVGEPIHEIVEVTMPFSTSDVRSWTTFEATRYRVSQRSLQRQYLMATLVANTLDPTFIYSFYDLFWRFLVHGERTGSMPSLRAGETAFWAGTHVTPTPWGLDYELNLLGRWRRDVLEISPHWGQGPGGRFGGLNLVLANIHVLRQLVVGGGVNGWVQPELSVVSNGVALGDLAHPRAFDLRHPPAQPGAGAHMEVRWEQPSWFLGFRVGAKSAGLSDLEPIAPSLESAALVGILLGRP